MNELGQYILVIIIVSGALIYIIRGLVRHRKHPSSTSCYGCTLAANCKSKNNDHNPKDYGNSCSYKKNTVKKNKCTHQIYTKKEME